MTTRAPAVLKIIRAIEPKSLFSHFSFSSLKAWSRLNHKRGKKSVLVAWSNLDFVVRTTRNSDLAETVCQKRTKKAIVLKCHDSLPDRFFYTFFFVNFWKIFFSVIYVFFLFLKTLILNFYRSLCFTFKLTVQWYYH